MVQITTLPTLTHQTHTKGPCPIYSISTSPTRLATSGQDFSIKIYSIQSLLTETTTTPLSTLQKHTGAALCVKWSPNAGLLASGSDDTSIIVWQQTSTPTRTFTGDVNIESYTDVAILTGHSSDVVDVSWSPCSTRLVSCSTDARVMIW